MGWNLMGKLVTEMGYDPKENFLFSDRYQMSSLLSFYGNGQRAYFLNLQHYRQNQFCCWPSLADEQIGKTGFFVLAENGPHMNKWDQTYIDGVQKELLPYFSKVEFLGIKPIFDG